MMNTRIHYLYRDADNYKVQNECVILGEMTGEQEQRIIACLDEEEYFVPSRVGMPERKFDTETDSDHPWFEWERIEETGQKSTLEITAEELVKRFEEASKGWESVRTAPESGKLPYCVTVQETLSRTVIVWAAERIDAEVTAQELCNAGDIELGSKDFVDRECTCDGVAEVGDFDTFEEYGGTQQPDAEAPAQEDAAQPAETLDSLNGPWRNDACLGYAAVAMERADLDEETIRKVMHTLESCFDIISVREAGDYYARKATVCGW